MSPVLSVIADRRLRTEGLDSVPLSFKDSAAVQKALGLACGQPELRVSVPP